MYTFSYFTEPSREKIIAFMKANSFAVITGVGEQYPVATQIPLSVKINNGTLLLEGHMMKKTDHHTALLKNNNVLVLFTGPHCFVDAGWYTNPQVGSTWNYMTVHAKGKISFMDEAGTRQAVKTVSDTYTGTTSASAYDNLPEAYISQMVKAICGFTIEVEKLEHIFKLSQNRDAESKKQIIEQLRKRAKTHDMSIADEMEKRL